MVVARSGKFLHLQMGFRTDTVSIDRLKPVQGPDPVPQQPPLRGRPPHTDPNTVLVLPADPPRRNPPRRARTTASSSLPQ